MRLEKHYKDMQDFEFTIQDGKLYMLQTRNGKRPVSPPCRWRLTSVDEGLIAKKMRSFASIPTKSSISWWRDWMRRT